jgi:elongation factor G
VKAYAPEHIRNVALVSHQGAGKTTLAEAILFKTGAIGRMGSVDEGTSNLDYHQSEIEHKTSIFTAIGSCEHESTKFNLVDTPGFEDFRGEAIAAMSVVESALVAVRADGGVEVGTQAVWSLVENHELPAIIVVTKMDKEHANYDQAYSQIRERLSGKAIPVQLPIGEGENFHGLVDVALGKAFLYDDKGNVTEGEIPEDMRDEYETAREELYNAAAEHDDALVEKFLEEGELTYEEITRGIQIGVRDRTFFPVCAVSATHGGVGMRPLLHCIKEYLPASNVRDELAALEGESETTVKTGPAAPALARVFKISIEKDAGEFSLMRCFAGEVQSGSEVSNVTQGKSERVTQLFSLEGKNREKIDKITCGDLGAAVKLKDTHCGDTLAGKGVGAMLPPIEYPAPNSRVALRPVHDGEDDKVAQGLHKLHEEDPTFNLNNDAETHEMVLEGMGEMHFEIILERLARRYAVEVTRHEPRIPYRETLKAPIEVHARHKKQSGGRGQFADVHLRFEPLERGGGFDFVDAIVGGVVPGKFIPAVKKGIEETMTRGALAGYRVVDLRATLFDGGFHAVDSSEAAFKSAAFQAMRTAFKDGKATILEPVYEVEVKVPEEVMGDVMGDLSSRRGRILGSEAEGHFAIVRAQVPLSELYRYSTSLRSMSQGRATYSRKFSQYEEVPGDVLSKIVADSKMEAEEA